MVLCGVVTSLPKSLDHRQTDRIPNTLALASVINPDNLDIPVSLTIALHILDENLALGTLDSLAFASQAQVREVSQRMVCSGTERQD